MNQPRAVPSPIGATYVAPSADVILQPGAKIGDLYARNMTQPYVLQRLAERTWWVQSFNYGTVFYVGDLGVLIFDQLEGAYDNVMQAVVSVTDKPITAAVYVHYHADHIGDVGEYAAAAEARGERLRIIGSAKTCLCMDLSDSSFPRPTDMLEWPRDTFEFEGLTVELHGFEPAAHCEDLAFVADLKQAVAEAIAANPFTDFVDPSAPAHTRFLATWFPHIARVATDAMRPRYGDLYGFEDATPVNAEMVAWAVFEYR
jgi:metallo-beta-lactamase superfamily protein